MLIPIFRDTQQKQEVEQYIHSIINNLDNIGVRYFVDWSDSSPGYKFNEWEMKGIPVRMEIGPRDVESNKVVFARRDNGEKYTISFDELSEKINTLLIEIQSNLLNQAKSFRDNNTHTVQSYKEFKDIIESGGFIRCGWDGSEETESKIKEETKATIRCIPFDENPKNLNCIYSGVPAKHEVIYAKAY